MKGLFQVFTFLVPLPEAQVETGFISWPVVRTITLLPAILEAIMLNTANGPHVMKRPDNGFLNS